jgi:hypothetical protein
MELYDSSGNVFGLRTNHNKRGKQNFGRSSSHFSIFKRIFLIQNEEKSKESQAREGKHREIPP